MILEISGYCTLPIHTRAALTCTRILADQGVNVAHPFHPLGLFYLLQSIETFVVPDFVVRVSESCSRVTSATMEGPL